MSPCPACVARGKTWEGSDPTCAFLTGTFDVANWNCATMNRLRELAEERGVVWRDDMSFGSFAALPTTGDDGFVLVMGWYKDRGRVAVARCMGDERDDVLTLAEAQTAIAAADTSERAYLDREIRRRGGQ